MKYTMCILLTVFGINSFAANEMSPLCQRQIASLESQGIKRGALLQALKNLRSGDVPSRYILMAETGRPNYQRPDGSRVQGAMRMIDLKTGAVKTFKMWSGIPENAADVLNYQRHQITHFGGQQVEVDERDFRAGHRMRTEVISPSLRNALAARGDQPGGNQVLLKCSQKFREDKNRRRESLNDVCLEPRDLDEVFSALMAERDAVTSGAKPSVVMFTYPTRNLDNYLSQVKLANDEPNVCKSLANMPAAPQPSAPAAPAQPAEGEGVE